MQKFEIFFCDFFQLLNLMTERYLNINKKSFYIGYVDKSISFEAIGILKMRTFAAKLTIRLKLLTTTTIFVLGTLKF